MSDYILGDFFTNSSGLPAYLSENNIHTTGQGEKIVHSLDFVIQLSCSTFLGIGHFSKKSNNTKLFE
jgi:hypothetical protein